MGRKWSDNFTANLASTINASAGTLSVSTGLGALAPTIIGRGSAGSCPDFIVLTLEDAAGNIEKIKCEAHAASSDVFGSGSYPLIRGYDGTVARSWTAGSTVNVDIRIDKSFLSDVQERLLAANAAFGIRDSVTTGLTFGYFGGQVWVDGVLTTISNSAVSLSASSVNYVERTAAGAVSVNTTGFTAGRFPMYEVTTNATDITVIQDRRAGNEPMQGKLTKSVAGSSDVTLTAAEARNGILEFTGALTGNISVIVPAIKSSWIVYNNTTGSFSLTVKTSGGTGAVVNQTRSNVLFGDGTNVLAAVSGFESSDPTIAKTGQNNTFTKAQRGAVVPLTDAATVALDLSLSNNYSLDIGGNRTLGNPTNAVAGQSGIIAVTQDGVGSRTLGYGSQYKFAGGTPIVLSTAVGSVDLIAYYVISPTSIYLSIVKDIR